MTKKTDLIVVDSDGELIVAANGRISSDNRQLVKLVKKAVADRRLVQIVSPNGSRVRASLDQEDLIGITAALFAANPGRTKILEAPATVNEWVAEESNRTGGGCLKSPSVSEDFQVPDLNDSNNPYSLRDMFISKRKAF